MSLTGVRRQLRSKGARAEDLVKLVEAELDLWVAEAGRSVVVNPSRQLRERRVVDPFLVGKEGGSLTEAIVEVQRGSASLIWEVGASFERFVVHCVARHHNLVRIFPRCLVFIADIPTNVVYQVSFSKSTPDGKRQTHILLPPSRSSHHRSGRLTSASGALDTPPTTDLSSVNGSGTDTDAGPAVAASTAYGGHWGSWDSESEAEPDGPASRLAPLIRHLAIHSGALSCDPASTLTGAGESDTNALSYEDDETSDDESVSSAALSSLADSLAQLPVDTDRRLLPHRPDRLAPAFVPGDVGETESEAEDADRTFTPASFVVGPPVASVKEKTASSGKQSFWAFVYA